MVVWMDVKEWSGVEWGGVGWSGAESAECEKESTRKEQTSRGRQRSKISNVCINYIAKLN